MASAPPTSISGPAVNQPATRPSLRAERLAEMVAGLTACAPGGALQAVAIVEATDPLEIVARAICAIEADLPGRIISGRRGQQPAAETSGRRGQQPAAEIDLTEIDLTGIDRRYRI
jgi:hypothetical protein